MKTYTKDNFFRHTFCEFKEVNNFQFPESTNYTSKSSSQYFYTKEGVYRKSNHWGRVANCRWKLITNDDYKNQKTVIAFANWTDFYSLNSNEKLFFLEVNFDLKSVTIQPKRESETRFMYTFTEIQKRKKQIQNLFKDDKWADYFDLEIETLRFKIVSEFIDSNKTLQEIKRKFK